MQERRTTVRVHRLSRAQYCPSDDLLPRDGRITNLSERGVGLLAHESHRAGERVTVSFAIPDEEEPVTATGVVRWSDPTPYQGRWYPMGLEWLPLEDTVRHRLHTFLGNYAQGVTRPTFLRPKTTTSSAQQIGMGGLLAAGFLIGALSLGWAITVQQENRQLAVTIQERDWVVRQLEYRRTHVEQELAASKTHLSAAAEAMTQLGQQAQHFERDVQRLSQQMEQFQSTSIQLRQEREALIHRVLDLEQEQLSLTKRLSSIPDLRRAMSEAIMARRRAQRRAWLQARRQRRGTQDTDLAAGNRGYVMWKGKPTTGRSTVWIKVHEPESLLTTPSR